MIDDPLNELPCSSFFIPQRALPGGMKTNMNKP